MLMPSPVTHITGYLYALELPFACGITAVLMEQWSGDQAARLIERHAVTLTIGATPFLVELVAAANQSRRPLRSLRLFACGGAPVPPEAIRHAREILPSCVACRIFGSSEAPTISLGVMASDPPDWSIATDGRIVNNEIRVVDPDSGIDLPFGSEGEILVRGPEVMLGYTDRGETALAFDEDGFFRTGDLGIVSTVDQIGLIKVTGRKKDLIIRGGENISPKEIEDILHQHPAIKEAAVVAKPHPRMGETPMAYVVLHPAASLTFDELSEFLDSVKLAKQKYPEELVIVEDLPRTVTGKVLKYALRDLRKG
jgi:acyl-CoA synthetase (AMP-forming)/AMP-acid ligase II